MSAYILSVCGAVVLSSLVTIILPEGKIGKFINGILKIFCVFVMLVPLVNWVSDLRFNPPENSANSSVSLDEDYLHYFYEKQSEAVSIDIQKSVEKKFNIEVNVVTEWKKEEYVFSIRKVRVKIKNFGMYGNDEHIIVVEQIKTWISETIKLDREDIIVDAGERE